MRTILLIQDDPSLREMFADVLTGEGYRVVVARDGAEAFALLAEVRPDLIAIDGLMPRMDGWEFLERYCELPGPRAPTLSISVSRRALPTNAALPQPFELDTFLELVRHYSGAVSPESADQ